MYVYLITNLINNKKYVGITNNITKRWSNHKCCNNPDMVIAKAIKKYGVDNFKFEIIENGISIEEIDDKEIYYIDYYQSHVSTGKGYNVSKGGRYNIANSVKVGTENGRALLTEEEVIYIKSHRNIPEYVLYDDFSDKITYETFKKVYLHKTYKNILPTVDVYPYNFEFSCQFCTSKIDYGDVLKLRNLYEQNVFWRDAYTEYYQKIYPDEMAFWNVYVGNRFKLVRPEIFTSERKHFQSMISHSGENNGRAKLTKDDVINIRRLFEEKVKTRKEIQQMYPQVSTTSINNIIRYATWKNI